MSDKPSKQMMKDAKKLASVRSYIKESQAYAFTTPDGKKHTFSGLDLIQTAEAFAQLLNAGNKGDEAKILQALLKIEGLAHPKTGLINSPSDSAR